MKLIVMIWSLASRLEIVGVAINAIKAASSATDVCWANTLSALVFVAPSI